MFTYTAVVACPRETYGYFMLIFISAYFLLERFYRFGDINHFILKVVIKVCKNNESLQEYIYYYKERDEEKVYGLSREMFEYLEEQIRPRRIQMLQTIIQFLSIVFILAVSIVLMERFRTFEDLSLFVHVFFTIFICASPIIYYTVVSKGNRKARFKGKVKKNLWRWNEQNGKVVNQTEPSSTMVESTEGIGVALSPNEQMSSAVVRGVG